MFRAQEIKKLGTKEEIGFGQGFYARCNSDSSISLLIRGRIKGSKTTGSLSTTVARVNKLDRNLDKILINASQKALDIKSLMSNGINPNQYKKEEEALVKNKTMTLLEALEQYDQVKRGTDSNTEKWIKERRKNLERVCLNWFDIPVSKITTQMILDKYLETSSSQNKKKLRTAELFYVNLRSVFNYLVRVKVLPDSPCTPLTDLIKVVHRPKTDNHLLPSEIKTFLRVTNSFREGLGGLINKTRLSKEGKKQLKEKEYYKDKEEIFYKTFLVQAVNFIEFLMLTGLRPDEAKKLEWKNVYLEGNEYNPNPFFVLDKSTRKRKEVYAIAITDMIKKILEFQKLLIGQGDIVNLASVDIFEEDDNPKKKKMPKYIFMCEADLQSIGANNYKLRGAPLINKPVSNVRSGFTAIKERMPKLKVAESFSPYTLRHTFTTIGNMCGYTDSELDSMTGHIKQGKTATSHYIARLVKDNRQGFKIIHKAMVGDEIKDKDIPKREDDISKKLKKASKEELIKYYHKGLMTAEEVEQYKVIPLLHKAYKQKYK